MSITHKDHFVNIARRRAQEANELASETRLAGKTDVGHPEKINGYAAEEEKRSSVFPDSVTGGFFADQFENLANLRAHYEGTGPEIWQQTDGNIDAFIAAAGTGGTLAGVSRFLQVHLSDFIKLGYDSHVNKGRCANALSSAFHLLGETISRMLYKNG